LYRCSAEEGNEDLEEGELLDDGEVDEKVEESQIVDPPAVIPSLLDMKISPPRNGKIFLIKHNIQHYMHILFFYVSHNSEIRS